MDHWLERREVRRPRRKKGEKSSNMMPEKGQVLESRRSEGLKESRAGPFLEVGET